MVALARKGPIQCLGMKAKKIGDHVASGFMVKVSVISVLWKRLPRGNFLIGLTTGNMTRCQCFLADIISKTMFKSKHGVRRSNFNNCTGKQLGGHTSIRLGLLSQSEEADQVKPCYRKWRSAMVFTLINAQSGEGHIITQPSVPSLSPQNSLLSWVERQSCL